MLPTFEQAVKASCSLFLSGRKIPDIDDLIGDFKKAAADIKEDQATYISERRKELYSAAIALLEEPANSPCRKAIVAHIAKLSGSGISEYGVSCEIQTQVMHIIASEGYSPANKYFLYGVFEKLAIQTYQQRAPTPPRTERTFDA